MTSRRVPGDQLRFPAQCRWDLHGLTDYEGQADAAALWLSILTKSKADEPISQDLIDTVSAVELTQWQNQNYDLGYAYVTMLGLYQAGGTSWTTARRRWPRDMPIINQGDALAGCIPEGQRANGATLGRITATAYLTLTNEVFYGCPKTMAPRD
jgi:hypothetical protein